jgi:hypothetical protein
MSERYPGGLINQTAPVPSGPYASSAASGIWTMDQQAYWKQQGLWPIPGNFPNYIEDVFSTYLYTGTNATQSINNGIDLAGKGGMVWLKSRSNAYAAWITDSVRGVSKGLTPSSTSAQTTDATAVTSYNSNGFTLGIDNGGSSNTSGSSQCSWTFAKQAKFFDVVTYTGDGAATKIINHSLNSVPGCVIVKCTSNAGQWFVYHTSLGFSSGQGLVLNSTDSTGVADPPISAATSTNVTIVAASGGINTSGRTYVVYLFATNAGGFGTTGTDNVISCGGGTSDGSALASVTLGYEPQFVLFKDVTNASNWTIADNMRGMTASFVNQRTLYPNLSSAEDAGFQMQINSTGFNAYTAAASANYIYIAIRRPMKVPTDATTVFSPNVATLTGSANTVTTNFPVDLAIPFYRQGFYANWFDRLRGDSQSNGVRLRSASTAAEVITSAGLGFDNNTGYVDNYDLTYVSGTGNYVYWNFSRRPGFFDVVCYTGNGASSQSIAHNLTVTPQIVIIKARVTDSGNSNGLWAAAVTTAPSGQQGLLLNQNYAGDTYDNSYGGGFAVASTTFNAPVYWNGSGKTYVAYLFATCPGVSKVGSYTGNGTTQAISCGFTGGARFVMIKRTDSTSDWFVYDTARGMTTLVDPYLPMNGVTETATLGSVTTTAGGFTLNASVLAAINASGGSYIFLAIA